MGERKHLLLLGAGFSRNWGGWLASEVFEYLLGCKPIATDDGLIDLLWKHKLKGGGFEAALAELQENYARKGDKASKEPLEKLQNAIAGMFFDMNRVIERATFNFSTSRDKSILDFLSRFDAIFSLNQDLLLEMHYQRQFIQGVEPLFWSGVSTPGLEIADKSHLWIVKDRLRPSADVGISKNIQPIFKLHGSSNWVADDGSDLLIMGGNKSPAIRANALLRFYEEKFREFLTDESARLMVIGYSFSDTHINDHISAAATSGLRLFVVDPAGTDVIERNKRSLGAIGMSATPTKIEKMVIGGSRRSLREIFGSDDVEFSKVMRFFSV